MVDELAELLKHQELFKGKVVAVSGVEPPTRGCAPRAPRRKLLIHKAFLFWMRLLDAIGTREHRI